MLFSRGALDGIDMRLDLTIDEAQWPPDHPAVAEEDEVASLAGEYVTRCLFIASGRGPNWHPIEGRVRPRPKRNDLIIETLGASTQTLHEHATSHDIQIRCTLKGSGSQAYERICGNYWQFAVYSNMCVCVAGCGAGLFAGLRLASGPPPASILVLLPGFAKGRAGPRSRTRPRIRHLRSPRTKGCWERDRAGYSTSPSVGSGSKRSC